MPSRGEKAANNGSRREIAANNGSSRNKAPYYCGWPLLAAISLSAIIGAVSPASRRGLGHHCPAALPTKKPRSFRNEVFFE